MSALYTPASPDQFSTMTPSPFFYDNLPVDDFYLSYMKLFNDADTDPEGLESACVPAPGGELAYVYRTFDGVTLAELLSSQASTSSSIVSSGPSGLLSSPPADFVPQPPENNDVQVAVKPTLKRKRDDFQEKTRKPKRRCFGPQYPSMLRGLPEEARVALQKTYSCCKEDGKKDNSTLLKHWFSDRHFSHLDEKFHKIQPCFTCPAYIGMYNGCKKAKFGRYDSTERHCKNCDGYREMCKEITLPPIVLLREEFDAIEDRHTKQIDSDAELAGRAIAKLAAMVVEVQKYDSPPAPPPLEERLPKLWQSTSTLKLSK